jgi:hypothetical protein
LNQNTLKIAVIQEARICLLASAAIQNSADPADALVVLLSGPLSTLHGQAFVPTTFAQKVREQFGWDMSADAVEFFVPKFRHQGWLKAQSNLPKGGPFIVDLQEPETEAEINFDTSAALQELGSEFLDFSSRTSPINVLPEEPSEAGAILLRFVVDAATPLDLGLGKPSNDNDYLCARFAEHATKENLPAKELLERLAAVGFLFRVADEMGSPSRRRRADLKVIVDGPLLLDLLGSSGPIRASSVRDVFESLKELGAIIATFAHCVEEAKSVLGTILRAPPPDRYGPTGDALRKGVVHENALRNLLQAFDLSVRSQGVQILSDTIESYPSKHQFFEKDRAAEVEKIINWHDEDNDIARYRDADTTVLTMRRREAYRTSDIFDSKYVCVTSNNTFAASVKRHLLETHYYNAQQVPPVVTLKELAARTWIEIGSGDQDKLRIPRSQLLLSCDKSLRLNRRVVERAKAHLARVNPDQLKQFELLLEVPRSARALMDATLNNEKYVTGDNVELLVEAAVEAAGREVAKKERDRRVKDTSRLKGQVRDVEGALEAEKLARQSEREALLGQVSETQRELNEARRRDDEMIAKVASDTSAQLIWWKRLLRLAYVLLGLIPLLGFALSLKTDEPNWLYGALVLLAVLFGFPVAMDRPGAWLSNLIKSVLRGRVDSKLRDLGRYDLAESVNWRWTEDQLVWERTDFE